MVLLSGANARVLTRGLVDVLFSINRTGSPTPPPRPRSFPLYPYNTYIEKEIFNLYNEVPDVRAL